MSCLFTGKDNIKKNNLEINKKETSIKKELQPIKKEEI
jgi:hypothetical protein